MMLVQHTLQSESRKYSVKDFESIHLSIGYSALRPHQLMLYLKFSESLKANFPARGVLRYLPSPFLFVAL